jgi:hypothetical protein
MTRPFALVGLIALAGCAGPDPTPLAWTATYPKPWQELTYCLNARSTDYQTVLALDAKQGIGGVELMSPSVGLSKTRKAGEFRVRRLTERSSAVTFRSAIRTVGGSSALEDWARAQAERCSE